MKDTDYTCSYTTTKNEMIAGIMIIMAQIIAVSYFIIEPMEIVPKSFSWVFPILSGALLIAGNHYYKKVD